MFKSNSLTILIVLALILGSVLAYNTWLAPSGASTTLQTSSINGSEDQEILTKLEQLKAITVADIDGVKNLGSAGFLKGEAYRSLRDNTQLILPIGPGRINPFAPLTGVAQTKITSANSADVSNLNADNSATTTVAKPATTKTKKKR